MADTRNIDPKGTSSALPRRSETASVRLNLRRDLTPSWLIFGEQNPRSQCPGRGQHLVGVAIDLHIAPQSGNPAVAINQNRCAKNAEEGLAVHRFLAPDAVGF